MADEKRKRKTDEEKLSEINDEIAKQEKNLEKVNNRLKELKLNKLEILEKMGKI